MRKIKDKTIIQILVDAIDPGIDHELKVVSCPGSRITKTVLSLKSFLLSI